MIHVDDKGSKCKVTWTLGMSSQTFRALSFLLEFPHQTFRALFCHQEFPHQNLRALFCHLAFPRQILMALFCHLEFPHQTLRVLFCYLEFPHQTVRALFCHHEFPHLSSLLFRARFCVCVCCCCHQEPVHETFRCVLASRNFLISPPGRLSVTRDLFVPLGLLVGSLGRLSATRQCLAMSCLKLHIFLQRQHRRQKLIKKLTFVFCGVCER